MTPYRPVALVILDGWGLTDVRPNACSEADTPNFHKIMASCPSTSLEASGEAVGLREGQMGDSNVGHLNIGAGRIVYQDVARISRAIADGSLFTNPALTAAMEAVRDTNSSLHLMGLLSDGGVHSVDSHLHALIDMAKAVGVKKLYVHPFLDGRDVHPKSAQTYLQRLETKMKSVGLGEIATLQGRFYAMDRDKRWDRVERAYRLLAFGQGLKAPDWRRGLLSGYERGESDEFLQPTVLTSAGCGGLISDGDSVVFFNFRADRAREITHAFVDDEFTPFDRGRKLNIRYCGMVRYEEDLSGDWVFAPIILRDTLGEVVSKAGLRQLRIAETEKYAHVTFFLNGRKDEPFPGEDRVLIPSPHDVATYDQKPEMSAVEVTEEAVKRLESGLYDFIVLNYANPDMVGHTGDYDAAVCALETVDRCLGIFLDALLKCGGASLVIADHGNVEDLRPGQKGSHTYHTKNRVPCILVAGSGGEVRPCFGDVGQQSGEVRVRCGDVGQESGEVRLRSGGARLRPGEVGLRPGGVLADVAPTLLWLLGLPKPSQMDRESLVVFNT